MKPSELVLEWQQGGEDASITEGGRWNRVWSTRSEEACDLEISHRVE